MGTTSQIWIDLPNNDFQETIQGSVVAKNLYRIEDIPFITISLNYHDIVLCKTDKEGRIRFLSVSKPSGYQTLHIRFTSKLEKREIKEIVRKLKNMGLRYRRSGIEAFSLSLPPSINTKETEEILEKLVISEMLRFDSKREIGSADQSSIHLGYLLGNIPRLRDGQSEDKEME